MARSIRTQVPTCKGQVRPCMSGWGRAYIWLEIAVRRKVKPPASAPRTVGPCPPNERDWKAQLTMSSQNQGKQTRSVPPPPPPVAAHSRPGVRRQSMDDLIDDFIVRANQRVSSIRSRQWDLLIPAEEVDPSQIISDEPPVAVHSAPVVSASASVIVDTSAIEEAAPVLSAVAAPVVIAIARESVPEPVSPVAVVPSVVASEPATAEPVVAEAKLELVTQPAPAAATVAASPLKPQSQWPLKWPSRLRLPSMKLK